MLSLRIKGSLGGDGGGRGFNFTDDLFYLSLRCLDSRSGVQYAKTRVCRELLDGWLCKKITFQGLCFDDAQVTLTEQAGFGPKLVSLIFIYCSIISFCSVYGRCHVQCMV